jgi:signal transduction histidine kinase
MDQTAALIRLLWASDDAAACLGEHLRALCAEVGVAAARVYVVSSRPSMRGDAALAETGPVQEMEGRIEIPLHCGQRLVGMLVFLDPRPGLALEPRAAELVASLAPLLAGRVDHAAHLRRHQTVRDFSARVSHETNNPLAVVVANLDYFDHFVETLEHAITPAELQHVRGAIEDSREAVMRLRHLSQRLNRFTPSQGLGAIATDDLPIIRRGER